MSRRTAIVEEFDDDTELPLPSHPLPNTGDGPLLEEIQDLDYEIEPSPRAGPASAQFRSSSTADQSGGPNSTTATVISVEPYKKWTCIYPIYIDAKRSYGTGERRIERSKSVWWPLSKDIADATNRLGLGTLHEVNKCHPRDWENPGRVRVQWKKDGRLINPSIRSKKQLLETVSLQIQRLKVDYVPKPPYTFAPQKPPTPMPPTKSMPTKGKQAGINKTVKPPVTATGRRLPIPPEPHPTLATRLSPYSPALSTGVLVDTVKAGMSAQENAGGMGGSAGVSGGQKGKRKLVRVRG